MQSHGTSLSALQASGEEPPMTTGNPKNPFVCNICKKTYSRLDHLGRHYRSHTSEKPFACDQCGKRFSRVDLLRRHRTNHREVNRPSKRSNQRGQRASKACQACAAAKVKCSETRPCPRCVAKHVSCENEGALELQPDPTFTQITPPDAADTAEQSLNAGGDPVQSSGLGYTGEQLATPVTGSYGENAEAQSGYGLPSLSMDDTLAFDDALMGDFLRDIVYPNPNVSHASANQVGPLPDVLDFGFGTLLDVPPSFFDRDFQPTPAHDNDLDPASPSRSGAVTPGVRKVIDISQQALTDSFWLWTPASGDNRSSEQTFQRISEDRVINEGHDINTPASLCVSLASRDRLLSMILSTCELATQRHVLSRFPSHELISSIISWFMAKRFDEVVWWLHIPSLCINQEHETFLAGLLSAAAVESYHPDIRRLGFAVQEAARIGIGNSFEEDNRNTRDLKVLQSSALQVHAGFWSGMRRKMEIAESFTYPLITMLRRSGRFRLVRPDWDEMSTNDAWREWTRYESFKRLTYHVLIQDTAISMSLLSQPLLSPAEFQLELPCFPALWTAASADEWSSLATSVSGRSIPTILDALRSITVIIDHQSSIDVQLSLEVVVASLWARVWQYRQLKAMPRLDGSDSISLPASGLHQELRLSFQYLRMRSVEWPSGLTPRVALKLELCLMHLHVSLEDIQVFAGKEGEAQARRTVPQLQTWVQSRDARDALHHAGQALKAASQVATGTLRGFAAVAVYHASLVLWAYGVLIDPRPQAETSAQSTVLRLDMDDTADLQRFLIMGQGSPCIRDYNDASGQATLTVPVTNPSKMMNSIAALLLNGNEGDDRGAPPIVTNLSKLMRSLGKAAGVMKRSQ